MGDARLSKIDKGGHKVGEPNWGAKLYEKLIFLPVSFSTANANIKIIFNICKTW